MHLIRDHLSRPLVRLKFELIRKCHVAWGKRVMRRLSRSGTDLEFRCNICGVSVKNRMAIICERETPSCNRCGSNLRLRSIVHLLSLELFGESLILRDFPENKEIVGLGMSDWKAYAIPLSEKFSYTNTHYHKEPRLNIRTVGEKSLGSYDFIISSEVFEHIAPPVNPAFENLHGLLKPRGVCIFTVPFMNFVSTWEHFPDLYEYEIIPSGYTRMLKNVTKEGKKQLFHDLIFHGGEGATLEMRIFSKSSLVMDFRKAGFESVEFHRCNKPEYGIIWPINWSLPISARRP